MAPLRSTSFFFGVLVSFFLFLCPFASSHGAEILAVRHWTAPEYTRVVIDTDEEIPYTFDESPGSLSMRLKGVVLPGDIPRSVFPTGPAVGEVSLWEDGTKGVAVHIETSPGTKSRIFKLRKVLDLPYRIVVDVSRPDVEKKEEEIREKVRLEEKKPVIVIDPGHGGEDPGAVGRYGTYEKNVVLAVSRYLRDILKERGYDAFLTRDGDYYVPFSQRLKIARDYGADLFMSVHADASRSRRARGGSVYCLSTRGASSETARLLADSQNLSDVIAGFSDEQGNGESDPITLSMVLTENGNRSRDLGAVILEEMGKGHHVKFEKVQEAPFRVLKLPDIPSVLVETAFISNPSEEKLLRKRAFQKQMAETLASAVAAYVPVPGTPVFVREETPVRLVEPPVVTAKKEEPPPEAYTVRKGDCLTDIAKRYGLTVSELLRINRLRNKNRILVGQELRIVEKEPQPPGPVFSYVVQRGDTLDGIARRFGIPATDVMERNHLRTKNLIFAGQTLEIPGAGAEKEVPPERPLNYVVWRGDTLDRIARRFGVSVAAVMERNHLRSKNLIFVGQTLEIPGVTEEGEAERPSRYVVQRGDTLDRVARWFDVSAESLMAQNGLKSKNRIYVGQTLKIPDTANGEDEKPSSYVVQRGDTLEGIARRFEVTEAVLIEQNGLKSKNRIYVGQTLKITETADGEDEESKKPSSYVVQRGDTLEGIARRFEVPEAVLAEQNGLKSKNRIYVGQTLKITETADGEGGKPGKPSSYVVKRGDTLDRIAREYDVTVESLLSLNGLRSRNRIYVNQKLRIP